MTALEETLAELSAALPEVSSGVDSVLSESQTLQDAIGSLLAEIGRNGSRAEEMVEHVEDGLGELRRTAADAQARLEDEADALDAGWAGCVEAVGRAEDDLEREVVDAAAAASALTEGALSDARGSAKEAEAWVKEALERVWGEARSTEGRLGDALAAAGARAEALCESVDGARTRVSDAVTALGAKMQTLLERARERLDEAVETFDRLRSAHDAHLPEQTAALIEGGQSLLDDLGRGLAEMLGAHVTEAVDAVLDPPLDQLIHASLKAEKDCAVSRETVEAQFENLKETLEPLFAAVSSVRALALEHGFEWRGSGG